MAEKFIGKYFSITSHWPVVSGRSEERITGDQGDIRA